MNNSKAILTSASCRATGQLRRLGQSLWLDSISRSLVTQGTLARYIELYAVTGLTSNPTIFDQAIGHTDSYDEAIQQKTTAGNLAKQCSSNSRWRI
jgi:transaldolase